MAPAVEDEPMSVGSADRMGPEATEPSENVRIAGGKTEVLS